MISVAMKIIDSLRPLLPGLAGLISGIAMTSCQTTSNPSNTTRVPMSMSAAKWMKVSSQPPRYYPQGVSVDCPTDHWSGEWVYTGDERGTRYFIPLHGLGERREMLVHDALSARSGRKLAEVAAEDDEILTRNIKNMSLFGPPTYAGLLLGAMGGGTPGDIDIHRLQKEWASSKEPH